LINIDKGEEQGSIVKTSLKGLFPSLNDWKESLGAICRGSLLGFLVGILPGGGANISSFLSYSIERKISKQPERLGTGAIEGVAAPEAANNAAVGGSFIPLMILGIPTNGIIAVLIEQLCAEAWRRWWLRVDPLVSQVDDTVFYQRSLWTLSSPEVRRTWGGLGLGGALAAAAVLVHPLLGLPCAAVLLATLVWELRTWECVAVSPWQVAWRRGWRRSIRRLPMLQIARVHLVERQLGARPGWVPEHWGRPLGSCYLAIELHNGRAVKLPRTNNALGRGRVESAAQFLRQRKRAGERERLANLREQARILRQARRLMPDTRELALKRELAQLRNSPRRVHRLEQWPGQAAHLLPDTAPDALPTSAPGDLHEVALYRSSTGSSHP
jgi:hypothetical protein